jgi:hypothetical protein
MVSMLPMLAMLDSPCTMMQRCSFQLTAVEHAAYPCAAASLRLSAAQVDDILLPVLGRETSESTNAQRSAACSIHAVRREQTLAAPHHMSHQLTSDRVGDTGADHQ